MRACLCALFGACTLCVLCHVCAASSSFVFLLVQALFAASGVAAAACRGKVSHLPFRMAAASASDATGDDIKLCPVCNVWVFSWEPSFDCFPCGRPVYQKCKEALVKQVRCHECSACSRFCAGFGFWSDWHRCSGCGYAHCGGCAAQAVIARASSSPSGSESTRGPFEWVDTGYWCTTCGTAKLRFPDDSKIPLPQ